MTDVASILRALADLAPSDTSPDLLLDVTAGGDQPFVWLGDRVAPPGLFSQANPLRSPLPWRYKEKTIERLRSYDALHHEERLLRVGWLFLCGPARIGGTVRRVCTPLLQRPARIVVKVGQGLIEPYGDPEPTLPVLGDAQIDLPYLGDDHRPPPEPKATERLISALAPAPVVVGPPSPPSVEDLAKDARTGAWIDAVVAAAGLQPVDRIVTGVDDLRRARDGAELVVVAGTGLFIAETPKIAAGRGALLEWTGRDGIGVTAFAHLYGLAEHDEREDHRDLPQPLPLTVAQGVAVRQARHRAVTVVSGAPGNGKSHLVCAVAVDAVARRKSVLVATPTPHAADVLGELLARQPGPIPVMFGSTAGRRPMIAALEGSEMVLADEVDRVRRVADDAGTERERAEAAVVSALERERRADRAGRWTSLLPDLRVAVPGVFVPGADLDEVHRRLVLAREKATWWRRRRLRKVTGAGAAVGLDAVADARQAAVDVRASLELEAMGGTAIGPAWDALFVAEERERAAEGVLVDAMARHEHRWAGKGRRAVASLVAALPAGRATRRARLAAIDAEALVRALPLWVGTLKDVEDLLPAAAGLFDLVIVDEAAQVDQFRAAGALLRAKRAVVVGDPRQLRHVSFVADADVAAALERHGVTVLADRLDVRRQSLYDVAAGAAPVTFLDEHFRSVPHLIDFSAKRFYDGRVKVATRNPVNEAEDVIDVVAAPDVAGEVDVAVELVASLVAAGQVGIGVITPFRAHADAIEAALLDRFTPEVIEAHGLRTGTAHSAQGSERDHLIVLLGLAVDDPPARWRFAEDPNLFNVLVTRGRRRLTVVTSLPEADLPRGIVADYLRHAATPPVAPGTAAPAGSWIASLAAELERNDVVVRVGYPVGRWAVDICVGSGADAVALDCAIHPDGPEAHVARHRTLRRAGWRVVDAFASRWDGDAAAAAVELRTQLG